MKKISSLNLTSCQPSMKVPPKRKGNISQRIQRLNPFALNESPSEKEGKFNEFAVVFAVENAHPQ